MSDQLSCGVNIENLIGSKIGYVIFNDFGSWAFPKELPIDFSIGFSYFPLSNLVLLIDIKNLFEDSVFDTNHEVDHIGCEWNCISDLFINFGYYKSSRPTTYPSEIKVPFEYNSYNTYSLGIGYRRNSMQINIGFVGDDRASKMEAYRTDISGNSLSSSVSLAYNF
jgi:hypothetical protein